MSIETLMTDLIAALKENTAALNARPVAGALMNGAAPHDDPQPTTGAAAGTKDKSAKPKNTKPAATEVVVTKVDVQQAVVKLVNALGRDAAINLTKKFGAPNVSGLKEEDYKAVLAEAEALVQAAKNAAAA